MSEERDRIEKLRLVCSNISILFPHLSENSLLYVNDKY